MIERDFDVSFVADLALREKQIQQNYRPIIAIHKWFARRPGTVFRSLLLSEFEKGPLRDSYYRSHDLKGRTVADPFMGGGTPIIEANRVGCDVYGFDINPMAYWIVHQEIEYLDIMAYRKEARELRKHLETKVGSLYRTACLECGAPNANVKYFLWVKIKKCLKCGTTNDLFPGYLIAEDRRHPLNVIVCKKCGELNEAKDRNNPGACHGCKEKLQIGGAIARNGNFTCRKCGENNSYLGSLSAPLDHRLFAIEYNCSECREKHAGRYFKKPDKNDLNKVDVAGEMLKKEKTIFVPEDEIPNGDETARLHRWGYRYYRELFSERQLLGLELSCRFIANVTKGPVKNALATNLSDLLRYQNMLCRYDTMALKSLDIFSVHGFPVGLVECESNLLGIQSNGDHSANIGSGGWTNIIEKYQRAKEYCIEPFEIEHDELSKHKVYVSGEWIGDHRNGTHPPEKRVVSLFSSDSTGIKIAKGSLDAVFTDPPYFGNVQYAELMDFCYVWLRGLLKKDYPEFKAVSTRNSGELTANENMGRGIVHFTEGLSSVFKQMGRALKPGHPLAFTYHHNSLEAYLPVAVAILDSGLTCSASLPCPGEMGASIHINGTGSSVLDTIFVCRSTGAVPRKWIVQDTVGIAGIVDREIEQLTMKNYQPSRGDIRCVIYGHLIRLAVWFLRGKWNSTFKTEDKIEQVKEWLNRNGSLEEIQGGLKASLLKAPIRQAWKVMEKETSYGAGKNEIRF